MQERPSQTSSVLRDRQNVAAAAGGIWLAAHLWPTGLVLAETVRQVTIKDVFVI